MIWVEALRRRCDGSGMHEPIRAVLFDFDGLIVDTESVGYETWRELFAEHGHVLPIEVYAQVVGSDFNQAYDPRRDLEERTGISFNWEEVELLRRAREAEIHEGMHLLPGVMDRLEEARALGLPCAVASSSPLSWVGMWMDRLKLRPYFHHLTTLDDTGKVKPDPSLFLHAAGRLGVTPEQALVFEDSLNGLRAAVAAGMRCIVAPGPLTRHLFFDGALRRVGALTEVSLAEFILSES